MDKSTILNEPETVDFKGVRYVSLRLLWDCNLRCIMCDHPHRARNEMSLQTAERVLDQLTHPVRLTFIGGEPCLWLMRYPQVLRRAIHDGHVVHMITNGILLEKLPDFVNAFRDQSVSVQFSIDGFEKTYERIRKRSSWAAVVRAIRLLQAKREEGKNEKAFITAGYLLMRSTLADLPQFIRFCAHEGLDAVSLTYTMIYDSMVQRGEISEEESVYFHQEETNQAINNAIDVAREEGISINFPPLLGEPTVFGRKWSGPVKASLAPGASFLPARENLACDKPWKEIFVNQDGTIIP
ncbi:MAG TPA: radical SAM protein, partial [Pyrinomonadaceae bacterium]|nr:radical SAM protein [Pyrinomonadaceae bacterium]